MHIAIVGSCGTQGSSVLAALAPQMKDGVARYQISAWTMSTPTENEADLLAKYNGLGNVTNLAVNLDDVAAVHKNLGGVDYVYAYTVPGESEEKQGRTIADACKANGVKLLIYNGGSDSTEISGGEYTVPAFDTKHRVEQYLQSINQPYISIILGYFLSNLINYHYLHYIPGDTPHILLVNPTYEAEHRVATVDTFAELGRTVSAILDIPATATASGQRLVVASEHTSPKDWARAISDVSGLPVHQRTMTYPELEGILGQRTAKEVDDLLRYFRAHEAGHFDGITVPDSRVRRLVGEEVGGLKGWARREIPGWLAKQL